MQGRLTNASQSHAVYATWATLSQTFSRACGGPTCGPLPGAKPNQRAQLCDIVQRADAAVAAKAAMSVFANRAR